MLIPDSVSLTGEKRPKRSPFAGQGFEVRRIYSAGNRGGGYSRVIAQVMRERVSRLGWRRIAISGTWCGEESLLLPFWTLRYGGPD